MLHLRCLTGFPIHLWYLTIHARLTNCCGILWGAIHINRFYQGWWMGSKCSCSKVFCIKDVLNKYVKFTGKYMCCNRYFKEKSSSVEEHLLWLLIELLNGSFILFKHWDRSTFIMVVLSCLSIVTLSVAHFCLRLSILILGVKPGLRLFSTFSQKVNSPRQSKILSTWEEYLRPC